MSETTSTTTLRPALFETRPDGWQQAIYHWPAQEVKASLVVAHGMGEHAARYDRFASAARDRGFDVYAPDHRGHGHGIIEGRPGDMGPDGWNRVVDDLHHLVQLARSKNPGKPVALLGHSMGSMLSHQYLYTYGDTLDAVALSGSPGLRPPRTMIIARMLASYERWRHGPQSDSELMQGLLFGKANEPFEAPGVQTSGYEWLSRDAAEVQRYVDDPLCGFVLRIGSLCDMYAATRFAGHEANLQRIPRTLPMYVFAGDEDPVNSALAGVQSLVRGYLDVSNATQLSWRWYEGGRHELLNDVNRDAVTTDLLDWLEAAL